MWAIHKTLIIPHFGIWRSHFLARLDLVVRPVWNRCIISEIITRHTWLLWAMIIYSWKRPLKTMKYIHINVWKVNFFRIAMILKCRVFPPQYKLLPIQGLKELKVAMTLFSKPLITSEMLRDYWLIIADLRGCR